MSRNLVFRQMFESTSSTYTYIVGCPKTREAVIIDPVLETSQRDAMIINELGLKLIFGLNTHVHADHITGTHALKKIFPEMRSVLSANSGGKADVFVNEHEEISFGSKSLQVRSTPGHTNGCLTFVLHSDMMAFTGDALLIRGCGRTDFQQGDSRVLYKSIWEKILSLPNDFSLFVGHNYVGLLETSVAEEKQYNPRLTKSEDEFVEIMKNLNLRHPMQIERAVPANMKDGEI